MNMTYLAHHGVEGQKHGLRKYQYEDGTWTELGKLRRRQAAAALRRGKDDKPSALEKITGSSKDIINNIRDIRRVTNKEKQQNHYKDAEKFTDQELRNNVNRLQLEKQYNDLLNQKENINTGQSKVDEILDVAAPVAAIGASAAAIAASIYRIKSGG